MKTALLLLLLAASAGTAQGQSVIIGQVLGADSTPVISAHLVARDSTGNLRAEAISDSIGHFALHIVNTRLPATLFVDVDRIGFTTIQHAAVRIGRNESVLAVVVMDPHAMELAALTVVGRGRHRSGFLDEYYERLDAIRAGLGHNINRAALETYRGSRLITALLRVPGVHYGSATVGSMPGAVPMMRQGCVPATYLDKMPIDPDVLADMDPGTLEGVLVYVGGIEPPLEYIHEANGCGLILAFTDWERDTSPRSVWKTLLAFVGLSAIIFSENYLFK